MTFSLRRLIITILFVLIIGATTIAAAFLSTFDLNNFRAEISDSISSRISQPVSLGQASFSIKHGPSFAFENILIGAKDATLHLKAEHVFFRLDVLPLLVGNFKFSEILFEDPDVTLKIGQREPADSPQRRLVFDQSLIAGDLLKSIRIRNGHFRVEDYRGRKTPFVFALEKLRMVIDDLSLKKSGWIELQTDVNCNNIRSPMRINGYIRAGDSSPFWNNAHYELEMRIKDFASDVLSQRYDSVFSKAKINGRTDIHLQLSGSPAEGLKFNSVLTGRDLGLILSGRKQPVPAGKMALSGTWHNKDNLHTVSDLHLQFGTMEAFGESSLDLSQPDPEVKLLLNAPRVALIDFNRFVESSTDNAHPPPEFKAGTFSLKKFRLSGTASSLTGPLPILAIKEIDLEIKKGALTLGKNFEVKDCNAEIQWANKSLKVKQITFKSKGIQFLSNGDFKLKQNGTVNLLQLIGQGDFQFNNLVPGKMVLPEKGLKASLFLDATYRDEAWSLKDNLLALPSLKMFMQGNWAWGTNRGYSFDITIPAFSLLDLPLISPAVRAINPEGEIAAKIHLSGGKNRPGKFQGTMALNNAHLKMVGPLAPLNKLNGTIELDWPHLDGQGLTANLGESAITFGLDIADLRKPKVDLSIKGESIRADELIFRSENTFLRNVDAKLSITDKALTLGPIHTRMDGGTDVTIHGTIDNFPTPDTRLNIEGKYGNIDEVIGLWISDSDKRRTRKKKKPGLLEIDIKTEAGEIANLPFEQSEAHITYRNRTLIIHPIKFKSGPGYGLGQVLVVYRDNQPPLLRMSGHLENFDALAVYQQLLQKKGIVKGRLRGDFYLQGTAGKLKETFLPSSFGAFNFEVRDGTLKKLRGLSEVLTVFNIYPMFTESGQERGVPFETITGNARLDNGILQTDNLFLKGNVMNMSMRGEQNLISTELDMELGIMPLRTLDRLVTNIPLAGWILTGEDKALVTAHFKLTGPGDDPKIVPIPVESASKQLLGVFERLFTLPVKIISEVGEALD